MRSLKGEDGIITILFWVNAESSYHNVVSRNILFYCSNILFQQHFIHT